MPYSFTPKATNGSLAAAEWNALAQAVVDAAAALTAAQATITAQAATIASQAMQIAALQAAPAGAAW